MKARLFAAAALFALGAAGAPRAAEVEIRHAVARVVVIPEDRPDVKVEIVPGAADLPALDVRRTPTGKTIINGHLRRRIGGCGVRDAEAFNPTAVSPDIVVRMWRRPNVRLADAPLITVRTPADVKVEARDAVFGSVGRAANVDLAVLGCGVWSVANASGKLSLIQAGSGDIRAGAASEAQLVVAGSGDISVGAVGGLVAKIAGSGNLAAERVDGPVDAEVAGSGDILVRGGAVSRLEAHVVGSGDIQVNASVGDLEAAVMGSGDIHVMSVSGQVDKRIVGSGAITIGR